MNGPRGGDEADPTPRPRIGWTVPSYPTGTLSGTHAESEAASDAVPVGIHADAVPVGVQADALRMVLARHEPASDTHCVCGAALDEETGLCWYGRSARRGLMELQARQHEVAGEVDKGAS